MSNISIIGTGNMADAIGTLAINGGNTVEAAEATKNTQSPVPNARRAPARSDSAPADSSSAANMSV